MNILVILHIISRSIHHLANLIHPPSFSNSYIKDAIFRIFAALFIIFMKKIVSLAFSYLLFHICLSQPNVGDSIDYIYIGIEEPLPTPPISCLPSLQPEKVNIPFSQEAGSKDILHRQLQILRLFLDEKSNKPLKYASYPTNLYQDSLKSTAKYLNGFNNALIEGIKKGKILCVCPDSLEYRYTYNRLLQEITEIEKENFTNTEEIDFPFQEFGIKDTLPNKPAPKTTSTNFEALGNIIDLVIEKGFTTTNSRPYFRILYLRLVWYNPDLSPHPHILAFIPYQLAAPYLSKMYIKSTNQEASQISVIDYFTSGQFRGHLISTQ